MKKKTYLPTNPFAASAPEDNSLCHDAVVLETARLLCEILPWAVSPASPVQQLCGCAIPKPYYFHYEYELATDSWRDDRGIVDLAVVDHRDNPFLLLEIKSSREAQSASAWTRQVRYYARQAKVPCLLVVAHDLGDVQRRYLEETLTPWLDLRRMGRRLAAVA